MANPIWSVGGVCVLAVAAGWNALGLRDEVNPAHPVAGLNVSETNASASLLGQFRTNTSSWLWLRTDLYLHNGVELRPLTESEKQAGRKGVGSAEADLGAVMGDENVVTAIPSAERDFRGWLGDLERATGTYTDMHSHTHNDPQQSIPLFRLMTWIDPNFVEGWTAGSTVIARNRTEEGTTKALAFLNEGLKANPESVSIHKEIAFVYITRRRDLATAVTYLQAARRHGIERLKMLPQQERDDLIETYRWLGLCYRDMFQISEMQAALEEGHNLFPDDPIIAMLLNQPPAIATEHGRKLWIEKHTASSNHAPTSEEEGHDDEHHDGHDGHDH